MTNIFVTFPKNILKPQEANLECTSYDKEIKDIKNTILNYFYSILQQLNHLCTFRGRRHFKCSRQISVNTLTFIDK